MKVCLRAEATSLYNSIVHCIVTIMKAHGPCRERTFGRKKHIKPFAVISKRWDYGMA